MEKSALLCCGLLLALAGFLPAGETPRYGAEASMFDADTAWRAKLTVAAWNPATRTARPSDMLANTG